MTSELHEVEYPSKKITSLQCLRGIAFLGIFFQHCGIGLWGTQGVSVFLVLSGFLMVYTYYSREEELPHNLKNAVIWGVKR